MSEQIGDYDYGVVDPTCTLKRFNEENVPIFPRKVGKQESCDLAKTCNQNWGLRLKKLKIQMT